MEVFVLVHQEFDGAEVVEVYATRELAERYIATHPATEVPCATSSATWDIVEAIVVTELDEDSE